MAFLVTSSGKLYYNQYGKGNPLLLIAGLGSDSTSWLSVIIGLSKHFRVITMDNRGVGQSSHNEPGISIANMADDCHKLIEHLKLEKVKVLGHSMGGMIAMELAQMYPEKMDGLILAATSPFINNRNKLLFKDMVSYLKNGMDKKLWFRNLYYWIFAPSFFSDDQFVEQALTMSLNYRYPQSDSSFENQVNAILNFDFTTNLKDISTETLVISGDQDLLFPANEVHSYFDEITSVKKVIIPNAGHSLHVDNPETFITNVATFMNN